MLIAYVAIVIHFFYMSLGIFGTFAKTVKIRILEVL